MGARCGGGGRKMGVESGLAGAAHSCRDSSETNPSSFRLITPILGPATIARKPQALVNQSHGFEFRPGKKREASSCRAQVLCSDPFTSCIHSFHLSLSIRLALSIYTTVVSAAYCHHRPPHLQLLESSLKYLQTLVRMLELDLHAGRARK